MVIETTVNIKISVRERLNNAARLTGLSHSALIRLLLRYIIKRHDNMIGHRKCIQYQEATRVRNWSKLHVMMQSRDYEIFLDLRKFCKRSVSFLVSSAIMLYLEDVVKEILGDSEREEGTDNYQFHHYILIRDMIDNVICWRIYWGYPKTLRL